MKDRVAKAKVVSSTAVMQELFMFMGANEIEALEDIPLTIEGATELGRNILSKAWFQVEHYRGGGMFAINDALLDLRHAGGDEWIMVCAMIDAMPEPKQCDDYAQLVLNMRTIRDEREIPIPSGLEVGLKVWPHPAIRLQAEA